MFQTKVLQKIKTCILCSITFFLSKIVLFRRHLLLCLLHGRDLLEKLSSFAGSQEIPHISRNPKVHYRTHKRPPTVSILGQPNPVHIPTTHLLEIHPNIIYPSTPRSPEWSLSLRFPLQDPKHPLSLPIRATCPAHLILLDFITRTILGEEYRSFRSSLCNLLHSPMWFYYDNSQNMQTSPLLNCEQYTEHQYRQQIYFRLSYICWTIQRGLCKLNSLVQNVRLNGFMLKTMELMAKNFSILV